MMKRSTCSWWLVGIFLLALALRCWGIYWGLPDRIDLHPDEHDYVIGHALDVAHQINEVLSGKAPFTRATLDPKFLNYPSFLLYLTVFAYGVLHAAGVVTAQWQAYLIGRCFSAFFGAATVLAVYLLVRESGGSRWGGRLAALWTALLPLDVWDSHVAATDVLMTFWVIGLLWSSVRLLRVGRWRDYVLAGACLGFAVGSKYTAAMAAVALGLAALLSGRPWRNTVPGLALAGVVSLAACFLVTPYSFLRVKDVLAAMAYEHHHTTGHHFGFSLPANGPLYHKYLYQVVAAAPFSMGLALYLCAVAGTLWALARCNRARLVVFAFCGIFFFVTGGWTFTPIRYYLPLFVAGAAFAGQWQGSWLEESRTWHRAVAALAAAFVLAYTAVFTLQTTARYAYDTRIQAGQWMDENLRPGSTIMTCGWDRYMGLPRDQTAFRVHRADAKSFWSQDRNSKFDVIEISSLEFDRHYRHANMPYVHQFERLRDPNGDFRLLARFEAHFINRNLYMRLDPMFGGYFVSPTIELYAPKRGSAPPQA